jgi:hypothetical protein
MVSIQIQANAKNVIGMMELEHFVRNVLTQVFAINVLY